jgi:hypothetical protein
VPELFAPTGSSRDEPLDETDGVIEPGMVGAMHGRAAQAALSGVLCFTGVTAA